MQYTDETRASLARRFKGTQNVRRSMDSTKCGAITRQGTIRLITGKDYNKSDCGIEFTMHLLCELFECHEDLIYSKMSKHW